MSRGWFAAFQSDSCALCRSCHVFSKRFPSFPPSLAPFDRLPGDFLVFRNRFRTGLSASVRLAGESSCIPSLSESRSWSSLTIVEWGRSSSISSSTRPYDGCPRSLSSISIASLSLAPWEERDLVPPSQWRDDFARGTVTESPTDMFLEGAAEPPSAWLGRWVGARTSLTRGTTNTPSSEQGVVSRVGHVETTSGVAETTPANKTKRSVTSVSSEGATTGQASGSGESCPQLVDGGKGEQALLSRCRGIAPSRCMVSSCGSRACHCLSPQLQRHCSQNVHRWVAHWIVKRWREEQAQQWQGVWVWRQEVLVSGARAVVLRLHPPHPTPAGARGLPHQTSHDGCLCAGASQVLARCGKKGEFQRQMTLWEADCQARCRTKLRDRVVHWLCVFYSVSHSVATQAPPLCFVSQRRRRYLYSVTVWSQQNVWPGLNWYTQWSYPSFPVCWH